MPYGKFLDHAKAAVEYLAGINRRSVGNRPVVVRIGNGAAHPRGMQLRGRARPVEKLAVDVPRFARRPDGFGIARDRFEAERQMLRRQGVVVVHRANMRAGAGERGGIAIGVEAPPRASLISRAELLRDRSRRLRRSGRVAVIRDDDLPWLRRLPAHAFQAPPQVLGTVPGHERDAQLNLGGHSGFPAQLLPKAPLPVKLVRKHQGKGDPAVQDLEKLAARPVGIGTRHELHCETQEIHDFTPKRAAINPRA